jgi:hypothetical protein
MRSGAPALRRRLIWALSALMLAVGFTAFLPLRAEACSCLGIGDIAVAVDEAELVMVGTLVDRRDGGVGIAGGPGTIYTYQVETWVKGDAGDVVEVHSGQGDGDCGMSGAVGDRIGAFLTNDAGRISGNLCSQVDPDVLLAAMEGPTPSSTGIGALVVSMGWDSPRLTVLDDVGATVTDLDPGATNEWDGTQRLDLCPETGLIVQSMGTKLVVWDPVKLESLASYDLDIPNGWIADVVCPGPDASSILLLAGGELSSTLYEVVPDMTEIATFDGGYGQIGNGYVVAQSGSEGDASIVDMATGEIIELTSTPANELRSISPAPHPTDPIVALLQTDFNEGGPVEATLSIVDTSGQTLETFDIPYESYSPTWLTDSLLFVQAYDHDNWEESLGYLFDLDAGTSSTIEGWGGQTPILVGSTLFGIEGSSVVAADIETGATEVLTTLPTQFAGPMVPVTGSEPTEPALDPPDAPGATTPPLVAPELGTETEDGSPLRWIALGAIAVFGAIMLWLGVAHPRSRGE